ncbi:hypothetical protein D3C84_1304310 [compost metagenome]
MLDTGYEEFSVFDWIDVGPGYRVYYMERGDVLIVLLAGGDKSSQARDIKSAIALAKGL